jgi:hypothetical protein
MNDVAKSSIVSPILTSFDMVHNYTIYIYGIVFLENNVT